MRGSLRQERMEFTKHGTINVALERNNELRQHFRLDPAPGAELGMAVRVESDLAVSAGEAAEEPLLLLPPIAPAPHLVAQFGGKIIGEPFSAFGEDLDLSRADFLLELPQRSSRRRFAFVESTLGHLPSARRIDALGHKDAAIIVDQHDPDTSAIGTQILPLSATSAAPLDM